MTRLEACVDRASLGGIRGALARLEGSWRPHARDEGRGRRFAGLERIAWRHEHDVIRMYLREARELLRRAVRDPRAFALLSERCRWLASLVRDHLWKEEHFL